jgi:ABC-type branched-subunit amino acid transport system substrate-binding protein
MRTNRLLVLLVVVGLLVSAFGMAAPLVGLATAQQAGDPLVLGVIGEVSGPTARGLEVAAMRLNASGPFRIGAKSYVVTVSTKAASTVDELKAAIDDLKANGAVAIFGPDDDTLAKAGASALAEAGIPVFTGATDPDVKAGDLVFRTRTNDAVLMNALAEALVTDLKQAKIVVYQGSDAFAAKGAAFAKALAERQVTPASVLIQTGDIQLADVAKEIMTGAPEAIVAFAVPEQVSELYLALRADGFEGTFATSAVEDPAFVDTLPEAQRSNLYGITNWTYGSIRKDSIDFTRDYEEMFKAKPHGLSAAAYDAGVAMVFAYRRAGLDTQAAVAQLLRFPRGDSIQGTFNPQLGNNELSADASVIVTGASGAPGIFLRVSGVQRLLGENVVPTATPTPLPTETPLPTATPDGVVATVNVRVLNVRSGPALTFEQIGTLTRGQQVPVIGANADFSFLLIPYRGDQAWIMAQFVTIFGDRSTVPIVVGPPPPVEPTVTPAPTGVPTADIAFVSANFTPTNLQPGVPFTMAVTVSNAGGVAAGEFAIATSFKPGDVYTAAIVSGLAPGQQTVVNLSATLTGTGAEQIAIILDLNNQVSEGATGEGNNNPIVTYKVDRPYAAQSSAVLAVNASLDLDLDAQPDATFIGTALNPTPQSALQQIQVAFNSVHYDFLASVMGGVSLGSISIGGPPAQGTVIGVRTSGGKFGLIQVVGYSGSDMQVNFFVYP